MSVAVRIDTAEPRILRDRLAMLTTGSKDGRLQWDLGLSSNIWVDLVTYSAILQPVQTKAEWSSSAAAPYGRLRKADFSLTGASWVEHSYRFNGDVYLYLVGATETVTTHTTWERNQGFWFSFFSYGLNDAYCQLQVRMGTVGIEIYSDGSVRLYKPVASMADFTTANLIGSGSITDLDDRHSRQSGRSDGAPGRMMTGMPTDVMIMPWRGREILITSNRGGGFSFTFEDIAADAVSPTITSSATMAWKVPYGQAMVQCAPLRFASSGALVSRPYTLPEPPEIGAPAPTCQAYYDAPGYGVQVAPAASAVANDGSTPFVPDGTEDTTRLRIALTGDGTNTPAVHGGAVVYDATTQDTDESEEADIAGYIDEITFNVPESPSGVQVSLRIRDADACAAVADNISMASNRPIEIDLDGHTVFWGRTGRPDYTYNLNAHIDSVDIDCRDQWVALERYQIQTPTPFDSRDLADVIEELAIMPGYSTWNTDIEAFGFTLAPGSRAAEGEWRLIPEAGDNPAEWIERLVNDYTPKAVTGWVPAALGPTFQCATPASLGTTPALRLYATNAASHAAYIALGYSEAEAMQLEHRGVWRTMRETVEEARGNIGSVWGFDPQIDMAVAATWADAASRVPNTVPSVRPDNWLGEPKRVSILDPALSTQAMVEYAAAVQRATCSTQRRLAELECDLLLKPDGTLLWKGECIQVESWGIYRVLTFTASLKSDARGWVWRPAQYTLEYVAPEPPS